MDLLTLDASALADHIAAGDFTAHDAVRACLDRIHTVDRVLRAFVDLRADAALAEARQLDDARTRRSRDGAARRPLEGVPVTVKSAIQVAGLRCETGSATRRGIRAAADAVVVQRLRAAGAIVLGTTNVAELLMGYESVNPLHGLTANPWDPQRTPGGSSGGESAAIAAGCSFAGLGSDGGGSIRVPAHFTGICGLKPTPGRVPSTGHQPPCLGPFSLVGVVGPMARSVRDLRRLFGVLAGWDAGDPDATPLDAAGLAMAGASEVWWFDDHPRAPASAATRAVVRTAVARLADAGYVTTPCRPAEFETAVDLWDVLFGDVARLLLEPLLGDAVRALPILEALERERGARQPLTAIRLAEAWTARDVLRAQFIERLGGRTIVCPVTSVPAFAHRERAWDVDGRSVGYLSAMSYTQWCNVLGAPAAVVPIDRTADGLPIGVQIIGAPFMDAHVLDVAAAIERGGGPGRPPMPWTT
jgi:Asp-tRNA(Asn)/Glu-tRNA(Gln) amidotransferase A subunit family amidase